MGGLVEEQLASALKFFASQDSSLLSDIETLNRRLTLPKSISTIR